jgi:hypothetical protein
MAKWVVYFDDSGTHSGSEIAVSVGRTQPLWEEPSESTAVDEIWLMVERMYFDGRITWRQRGLFQWAARKSREVESPARCSRCAQSIDGVEEL